MFLLSLYYAIRNANLTSYWIFFFFIGSQKFWAEDITSSCLYFRCQIPLKTSSIMHALSISSYCYQEENISFCQFLTPPSTSIPDLLYLRITPPASPMWKTSPEMLGSHIFVSIYIDYVSLISFIRLYGASMTLLTFSTGFILIIMLKFWWLW